MRKLSLSAFIAFLSLFIISGNTSAQDKKFQYGGVKTCMACHLTKKSGAQYKIWKSSPHAKAFETLKTDKAKEVGKEMGVDDPATSEKCLKCHVTGFEAADDMKGPKLTMEEGVGCESCHGPGSEYKDKVVMTKLYKGELKAEDYGLIKPVTEKVCLGCHGSDQGGPMQAEFVFEEKVKKIAHPIPK